MKVTVEEKSTEKEYPWIGINQDGMVVLFIQSFKGLCLKKYVICEVESYFLGDWDEECFKPFHGEITLSNS